jgi:5,10-methylenetetrahydromethanopterin reductase
MDFAIALPSSLDSWRDVVLAEERGFTHAWFYDSQMLYSDVYVCMARAAEKTKKIKLGTGVAIPSNRIAPVTAHSIGTIAALAPKRTILGVGAGFTGRNTMGLPPVPLAEIRRYVETTRKLLRGEEVLYREGKYERWIRHLHPKHGYVNFADELPIYIAANGPKALKLTGEIADGWISLIAPPEAFAESLKAVKQAAAAAGRPDKKWETPLLTTGCVLRAGETIRSQRVVDRVGPFAIVALHALWEASAVIRDAEGPLNEIGRRYREEYVERTGTPADRAYLKVHEGHLIYLKPGEEKYLDEDVVSSITLTGTADDIIARVKALEKVGATQVALQVVNDGKAMIDEFSEQVIARY